MRRNCPATALAHPSGGRTSCAAGCGGWGLLYFIFYFWLQTVVCTLCLCAKRVQYQHAHCDWLPRRNPLLPSVAVQDRFSPGSSPHQHERQRQRCQMVRGSGADGDLNHRTRFAPRKLSFTFQRKQQLQLCASALWDAVPVAGLIPPPSRTLRLQVDHGPAPSYALTGARRDANNAPIVNWGSRLITLPARDEKRTASRLFAQGRGKHKP